MTNEIPKIGSIDIITPLGNHWLYLGEYNNNHYFLWKRSDKFAITVTKENKGANYIHPE